MIIINTERYFKKKGRATADRIISIDKEKNTKIFPVVQIVTETRALRNSSNSEYTNTSSREIKKWFGTRRL